MADEKKQELAPEDLENVDGGVILHHTKLDEAIAKGNGKTEAEVEGICIAELEGRRLTEI